MTDQTPETAAAALLASLRAAVELAPIHPAAAGSVSMTAEVTRARADACLACHHRRPGSDRCSLMSCGCALTGRQVSPWATCPDGRWPT